MHNGFVRVDDEKMSKSLGNFFTVRDILKRYDAEVVRFFILRAHYRSPLNYSDQNLDEARQSLTRLYTALKGAAPVPATPDWGETHGRRFREAMDDDFNTPEAIAVLFDLANELNKSASAALSRQLRALGGLLGLLERDAVEFLQFGSASTSVLAPEEIEQRIRARAEARKQKDFKRADEIRAELLAKGVTLEDGPQGTTWRRA